MVAQETATEHPHVVQIGGVRGGRPVVRGTGLTVELLARFHQMGTSPDELLATYPQLTPAALYDALSYYHDRRDEIDRDIAEVGDFAQAQTMFGFTVGPKGQVIFTRADRAG
jgi:uncharacterized protein (DUF433 family)